MRAPTQTQDRVKRFAESESRVRLLVRSGQRGLAGRHTYGWAHSDADLLGVMDGGLVSMLCSTHGMKNG